jgi:hypothetical protein
MGHDSDMVALAFANLEYNTGEKQFLPFSAHTPWGKPHELSYLFPPFQKWFWDHTLIISLMLVRVKSFGLFLSTFL